MDASGPVMQLRDYQKQSIASILEAMEHELNVLLQAPTGAGKTIIFSALIKKLLEQTPGGRILLLAHRQELISQAEEKLRKVWEEVPGIAIACAGKDKRVVINGNIVIASIQTLANRIDDLMPFNLCIVDEAHRLPDMTARHTQYITVLEALRMQNPDMRLLGVTATPYRLGHGYIYGKECKEGKINLFNALHHQISVKELTADQYLAPIRGKVAIQSSLYDDLRGVKVSGDYAEGEVGEVMSKSLYVNAAVEMYRQHAPDRMHVMVFACTIGHAELLCEAFFNAGYRAEVVHSGTRKDKRKRTLDDFVDGKIHFLVNVNVLIEGFDAPLTDCIIMARPTLSPALFLQQAGRGLRVAEGKENCLLIDLVGNSLLFGNDFDNIRVKVPRLSEDDAAAPSKTCPECAELVHCSKMECPGCGYLWPPPEFVEAKAPDKMRDIKFNQELDQVEAEIISSILAPYQSQKGNEMLRLELRTDQQVSSIFHYLNFDESAHWYQRQKSRTWWKQTHGWDDEPPENNDAALFLFRDDLLNGTNIKIKKDGDFYKIAGW